MGILRVREEFVGLLRDGEGGFWVARGSGRRLDERDGSGWEAF